MFSLRTICDNNDEGFMAWLPKIGGNVCPCWEPGLSGFPAHHRMLEHETLVEVEENSEKVTHQESCDEPDENHCQVVFLPPAGLMPDGGAAAHALPSPVLAKLYVFPDL